MRLPLTNNPSETFSIEIFESVYLFKQLWNTLGFWTISISDVDNNPLVYGVKIVALTSLLRQYPNIRFNLLSTTAADPGRNDLAEFILEVIDKDG